eukprot:XP_004913005.1 PREDICTED: uncharacterized protein LOC101734416 [Xenopus tropicalis]
MALTHSRRMGSQYRVHRLSHRIRVTPTMPILHVQTSTGNIQTQSLSRRDYQAPIGGSDHTSPSGRPVPGLLLKPFCSSQKGWLGVPSSRPQRTQQVDSASEIQDGVPLVSHRSDVSGTVSGILRHKRCLSTCTNFPSPSEILAICLPKPALPIHRSSVRPILSSTDLHQGHGSSHGSDQEQRNINHSLFGRYTHQGSIPSGGTSRTQFSHVHPPATWLVHQPEQVFPNTQPSQTKRVLLPQHKIDLLQSLIKSLLSRPTHTIKFCMKVLGVMVSTIEAVPFAQHHLRELQWNILASWKRKSLLQEIRLSRQTRASLTWWLQANNLSLGKPLGEPRWHILTTNASLFGCVATLEGQAAQGQWSPEEKILPINLLEIRAIRLGLLHWQHDLTGKAVKVQSDNSTAVEYINHQGGTRSRAALNEVKLIFRWAEFGHLHPRPPKLGGGLPEPAVIRPKRMVTKRRNLPRHNVKVGSPRGRPDGLKAKQEGIF